MAFRDYILSILKGVANGIATLDGSGKVPITQLPASVIGGLNFQGAWNANTNMPALASGVGTKGYYYIVSVAGTTNLDGITDWQIGDFAVFSGSVWQKVDNTDQVVSVFSRQGAITAQNGDYIASQITNTPAGNISALTVQAALNELDSEKQVKLGTTVVVNSLADFPTPVANVITLVNNTTYLLQGAINIGLNRIVVGASNTIMGFDKSSDQIIYTGAAQLFTITNQSFSLRECTITCPTALSSVFNANSTSAFNIEVRDCIFGGNKSLGIIQGFNAVVFQKNYVTLNDIGIQFIGTTTELIVIDNLFVNNNNIVSSNLINIVSGTFSDITISRNYFAPMANETALRLGAITLVNFGNVNINVFTGTGTYLTGVSFASVGWNFASNTNVKNTPPNGQIGFNNNIGTMIATTTYAVVGGGIYVLKAGGNKFDMPVQGQLRYTGKSPTTIRLLMTMGVQAASSYVAEVAVFKNGLIQAEGKIQFSIYTTSEAITVQYLDNNAVLNDFYDIRIRKVTGLGVTTTPIDITFSGTSLTV